MKVSTIVLIISTLLTSTLAYMVWNKSNQIKDQTQEVTQKTEAELILQVDSCKVYHLYNHGHDVYMAVKGNSVSISR